MQYSLVPPGEVQEEPRRLRSQGLSLNFAGEIIIISSLLWHFLKVCPFNASHHVPAPEVDFHVRTCSDRKVRLALFLKPASILTWCQGGGDGEVQLVDAAAKAAWKLEVAGEWGLSCRKKNAGLFDSSLFTITLTQDLRNVNSRWEQSCPPVKKIGRRRQRWRGAMTQKPRLRRCRWCRRTRLSSLVSWALI